MPFACSIILIGWNMLRWYNLIGWRVGELHQVLCPRVCLFWDSSDWTWVLAQGKVARQDPNQPEEKEGVPTICSIAKELCFSGVSRELYISDKKNVTFHVFHSFKFKSFNILILWIKTLERGELGKISEGCKWAPTRICSTPPWSGLLEPSSLMVTSKSCSR